MIKIAIVSEPWFPLLGGGQEHAWKLATILAKKHKCKVTIYTRSFGDQDPTQIKVPTGITICKLGPKSSFDNLPNRVIFLFFLIFKLVKDRKKYDLIHAHAYIPGFPAKIISLIINKPVVYTVHGTSLGIKGFHNKLYSLLERFLLTQIKYDAEITVSRDFIRIPNKNINVRYIPTGFDSKKYYDIKRNPKKMSILFVGRLHKQKALKELILGVGQVRKKFPNIILNIVGEGNERESLENLTKNKGLGKNVFFKGKMLSKDLEKEYSTTDLFILPSHFEGSPITLFEAWACGIPVIVNNVGEMSYMVEDGKNGYLLPNNHPASIAKTLSFALKDSNRNKVGLEGKKAAKKYTWERMTREVYKVYREVLK